MYLIEIAQNHVFPIEFTTKKLSCGRRIALFLFYLKIFMYLSFIFLYNSYKKESTRDHQEAVYLRAYD